MLKTFARPYAFGILLSALLLLGCESRHLVNERNSRAEIKIKFEERKALFPGRSEALFAIFDESLADKESEALQFLYAYMPLNDLADYDGKFWLANVRSTLRTFSDYPWAKKIPEDIFLNFILPVRVNNENLDSFRIAYYEELKERLEGFTDIGEAALEVNHWCHEKVTYQPSDIRTSAPMSTILSARGRCGEESTFTVAALRTAGIPARQVYTPRWAHSDDNHAWVEVYINGEWKYMGACEPEPVLDRGWFTEPARRAMLVHTRAFGRYTGSEDIITGTANYSEINNLSKYAATKDIIVRVISSSGEPVEKANVEFQLYNYAEFYPLARIKSDKDGFCRFRTGFGDLLVWASDGGKFGFVKLSVASADTAVIELSVRPGQMDIELDLSVPAAPPPFPGISAELAGINRMRSMREDSIRQAYVGSWQIEPLIDHLVSVKGYERVEIESFLAASMGNFGEISRFLSLVPSEKRPEALKLLEVISEKDLRDTPSDILLDHLLNASRYADAGPLDDLYVSYVLNPRISTEIIKPWRSFVQGLQDEETVLAFRDDPEILIPWIEANIRMSAEENYYGVPVSPRGVYESLMADELSRKIFFVACCRSCGIPSRLEPGTLRAQYHDVSGWNSVYFTGEAEVASKPGTIILEYHGEMAEPEYYLHFTLAKLENGRYNTLEYDYNRKVSEFGDLELPAGDYLLVTGNRISSDQVLADLHFFNLKEGETVRLDIMPRTEKRSGEVIGMIDAGYIYDTGSELKALSDLISNGVVIAWLEPEKEPTKHVMNDIPLLKEEFDRKGLSFLFLVDSALAGSADLPGSYPGLPERSYFGVDNDLSLLSRILPGRDLGSVRLPVIIYSDDKGRILFMSEGYTIGIGDQILKNL